MSARRPTEFRGCIFDDGWEFEAPCVVYYPRKYRRYTHGNNSMTIDNMVEEIACDIMDGRPHQDGDIEREMEWRGWGARFDRRKSAEHVVIKGHWSDDGWFEIDSVDRYWGPPSKVEVLS